MTIDEAIIHAEEVASSSRDECAHEHKQLADWLKDYKRLKEQEPSEDRISRQTAIKNVAQIAKVAAKSDKQKSLCGRIIFMLEHQTSIYRESEG